MRTTANKVYFIGDVGGWTDKLLHSLKLAGVVLDSSGRYLIPEGVTIIQMGDLVRLRPQYWDSNLEIVNTVLKIVENNPGQWYQLLGNHDVDALLVEKYRGTGLYNKVKKSISGETLKGLRKLRKEAYPWIMIEDSEGEQWVCTHSGVTEGYSKILPLPLKGSPAGSSIKAILKRGLGIHQNQGKGVLTELRSNLLLNGEENLSGDIYHVDCCRELLPSWTGANLKYNQIVGHSQVVTWVDNTPGEAGTECVLRDDIPNQENIQIIPDGSSRSAMYVCENGKRLLLTDPRWGDSWLDPRGITSLPIMSDVSITV